MSKTRHQKDKKQVHTAFAYELLCSTITVCAHSAATTRVGTAIGEAIMLADADHKFYISMDSLQAS